MSHEEVVEEWIGALRQAYRLAYATRLRELRGQRNALFDSRGLEPFSEAVGRAWALQKVVPDIAGLFLDHLMIKSAAREDALSEFRAEVVKEALGEARAD